MYWSKIMFLSFNFLTIIIILSSTNLFSLWIMMEMNMMMFIPMMFNKKNQRQSEAMMKYFLIQTIASSFILFAHSFQWANSMNLEAMVSLSMMLKIALFPFQNWILEIMEGLSWMQIILISTWQKVPPLYILNMMIHTKLILAGSTFSIIMGSFIGLNQTLLRKIMASSSIIHTGWTTLTMTLSKISWIYYFFIYTFLSISLIFLFNKMNMYHIVSIIKQKSSNILFLLNILSLAGLPPLTGFMNKFMIIFMMFKMSKILTILMILISVLSLFFYMRLSLVSYMFFKTKSKMFDEKIVKISLFLTIFSSNIFLFDLYHNLMILKES